MAFNYDEATHSDPIRQRREFMKMKREHIVAAGGSHAADHVTYLIGLNLMQSEWDEIYAQPQLRLLTAIDLATDTYIVTNGI